MMRSFVVLGALILLPAGYSFAQGLDNGSCVYNREVYPEGYELCQTRTLKRCEEGAWADIGDCDREPPPPPRSRDGDETKSEAQPPGR